MLIGLNGQIFEFSNILNPGKMANHYELSPKIIRKNLYLYINSWLKKRLYKVEMTFRIIKRK